MDVKVVNNGRKEFPLQYNSVLYLIPAGKSRYVPEEALTPQLGYVGAVNTPKHKRREEEVARLRILYGCYDDDDAWEAKKAALAIEVYDHEDQRVWTPLDDPAGTNVRVADDMDEKERLESIVANLIGRIDQLEGRANAGAIPPPDAADDTVPIVSGQPSVLLNPGNVNLVDIQDGLGGQLEGPPAIATDDDDEVDDLDAHLDFEAPDDRPDPSRIPVDDK